MRKSGATIIICFVIAGYAYAAVSPIQLFDSFGDICCDDEKARLDNFAVALEHEPEAQGYIIFYGGRRQNYPYCHSSRQRFPRRGESQARVARLKSYLVNARVLDPKRIVVINGGYRESWTAELWIVPKGANPPAPSPTIQPQDIKFRKGKIKKRDYECEVLSKTPPCPPRSLHDSLQRETFTKKVISAPPQAAGLDEPSCAGVRCPRAR